MFNSCDMNTNSLKYYSVVVLNGESVIESKAVPKEFQYTLPNAPKENNFKGWRIGDSTILYAPKSKVKITSDTTITAVFEEISETEPTYYSVVVLNKEELVDSKILIDGSEYILPIAPEEDSFKGWKVGNTTTLLLPKSKIKIKANTTITAVFEEISETEPTYYSVVVLNKEELVDSKILLDGSEYVLPIAPEGNNFKGWKVGDSEKLLEPNSKIKIKTNTTITAVWENIPVDIPSYYAVVVLSDGSLVDSKAVQNNSEYVLPQAPIRTGFLFNGWKVGEQSLLKAGEEITITGNTTITADWSIVYSVVVEVPQNVLNVSEITIKIDDEIIATKDYGDFSDYANGYFIYTLNVYDLSIGMHSIKVETTPAEVNKTDSIVVSKDGNNKKTIRVASTSDVIDLADISTEIRTSQTSTVKVDSKYNLTNEVTITVPTDVVVFYTTNGEYPTLEDSRYTGSAIIVNNGETLILRPVVFGKLAKSMSFISQKMDLSPIGARGPAGGYVFYDKGDKSDGWRMLEAGESDLENPSLYTWGSVSSEHFGTTVSFGYGKRNTENLIKAMKNNSSLSFPAAEAVWNVDVYKNGFSDWFLPSWEELSEMYSCFKTLGMAGTISQLGMGYWSSTEQDYSNAVFVDFSNGSSDWIYRANCKNVRPVRSF